MLLLALSLTNAVLPPKYQTEAEVKRILESPFFKKMSHGMVAPDAAQITAAKSEQDGYTQYDLALYPKCNGGVCPMYVLELNVTILPYPQTMPGPEVFGLGYFPEGVVEAAPGRKDLPPVPAQMSPDTKLFADVQDASAAKPVPQMPSLEVTPIKKLIKELEKLLKPRLPFPLPLGPGPVLPYGPLFPLGPGPVMPNKEKIQKIIDALKNLPLGPGPVIIPGITPGYPLPLGPGPVIPSVAGKKLDADQTEYTLKVGEMGYLSETAMCGFPGAKAPREQVGEYHANDSAVVKCEFAEVPSMLCGGVVCQQRFYAEKPGTTTVSNDRSNKCYKITVTK